MKINKKTKNCEKKLKKNSVIASKARQSTSQVLGCYGNENKNTSVVRLIEKNGNTAITSRRSNQLSVSWCVWVYSCGEISLDLWLCSCVCVCLSVYRFLLFFFVTISYGFSLIYHLILHFFAFLTSSYVCVWLWGSAFKWFHLCIILFLFRYRSVFINWS